MAEKRINTPPEKQTNKTKKANPTKKGSKTHAGNFQAQCGNKENAGLLSPQKRIQGIQKGENPYHGLEGGLPPNSPVFFGRNQECHEIIAALRRDKPACISLVGERRIGKSSLLNQIFVALSSVENLIALYGTGEDWRQASEADFFAQLQKQIEASLSKINSSLPTQQSTSPVKDVLSFQRFLRLPPLRPYRFVLILDEFETFASNPHLSTFFFTQLRVLGNTPAYRWGYLLASQSPLQKFCEEDQRIAGSAFWNIFGNKFILGLLSTRDAQALFQVPFQQSLGKQVQETDCDKFFKLTGQHPAFLQLVLQKLWFSQEGGYPLNQLQIKANLVEYFQSLWQHRSSEEQSLLLQIAQGKKVDPSSPFLLDLQLRGLLQSPQRLFCPYFQQQILQWKKERDQQKGLVQTANEKLNRANQTLEGINQISQKGGKLLKKGEKTAKQGEKLYNKTEGVFKKMGKLYKSLTGKMGDGYYEDSENEDSENEDSENEENQTIQSTEESNGNPNQEKKDEDPNQDTEEEES